MVYVLTTIMHNDLFHDIRERKIILDNVEKSLEKPKRSTCKTRINKKTRKSRSRKLT
jgi:hypothetical protein